MPIYNSIHPVTKSAWAGLANIASKATKIPGIGAVGRFTGRTFTGKAFNAPANAGKARKLLTGTGNVAAAGIPYGLLGMAGYGSSFVGSDASKLMSEQRRIATAGGNNSKYVFTPTTDHMEYQGNAGGAQAIQDYYNVLQHDRQASDPDHYLKHYAKPYMRNMEARTGTQVNYDSFAANDYKSQQPFAAPDSVSRMNLGQQLGKGFTGNWHDIVSPYTRNFMNNQIYNGVAENFREKKSFAAPVVGMLGRTAAKALPAVATKKPGLFGKAMRVLPLLSAGSGGYYGYQKGKRDFSASSYNPYGKAYAATTAQLASGLRDQSGFARFGMSMLPGQFIKNLPTAAQDVHKRFFPQVHRRLHNNYSLLNDLTQRGIQQQR